MTVLELVAQQNARVTYDRARRRLERDALIEYRQGHIVRAAVAAQRARLVQRYGPGETIVVAEIG